MKHGLYARCLKRLCLDSVVTTCCKYLTNMGHEQQLQCPLVVEDIERRCQVCIWGKVWSHDIQQCRTFKVHLKSPKGHSSRTTLLVRVKTALHTFPQSLDSGPCENLRHATPRTDCSRCDFLTG